MKRFLSIIVFALVTLLGFQSAAAPQQGNVFTPNKPNRPFHKQVHTTKMMKSKAHRQALARQKKLTKRANAMSNSKAQKKAEKRMKRASKRALKAQPKKNTGGRFLSPVSWKSRH